MLTPTADETCRNLANYIKDSLNAAYPQTVVQSVRDYNAWSTAPADFPLLTVYRTSSFGPHLEQSNAVIAYYLPSMAAWDTLPGIMNWFEKTVAALLATYQYTNPCMKPDNGLRSEYKIGQLGDRAFPYIKIYFSFADYDI